MPNATPSRDTIFCAAIEIEDAADRAAYLAQACGGDDALRQRVEALVAAHFRAGSFMDRPADTPDLTAAFAPTTEELGTVIGPYKLLQKLGEGGMGTVYMAEQLEPVRRRVALKIIKAGMDSAHVIARFEQERQALALMDHPHIAKVLDAGATASGRPYFVMELVKGVPIAKYCDHEHLTPKERLELFMPVCQAVQHAHQKGIIHRDLKPSNVLIALYDGQPVPKVIDFGVAKATAQNLTEKTLFTEVGQVIGTLEYMAPEQAELNNLDIDTRADIYSLGVLLYELLTGSTPFTRQQLRSAAFTEMLRMIREVEPSKPSTKLSSSESLPSIAANRKLEPARLCKLVTGELDWIVMKALEKDRGRRYETANAFAADVQRYLSGEAVEAYPPSSAYRLRKFVRRNKGQVIAASLVLLALVAGVIGTSIGLVQANWAAEAARIAKRDGEEKRKEAEANLGYARKANEILGSVFTRLDPRADYKTVDQFKDALKKDLATAVQQLEDSGIADPLEVAAMQTTLGLSLQGVGDATLSVQVLEKALATRTAKLGADHPDTLKSMNNLAMGYMIAGKQDLALKLWEETLKLRKAKLGADHPDTLGSMTVLAAGHMMADRLDLALPLLEGILKLRKAKLGADHPDTLRDMFTLAAVYQDAGKLDLAFPLFEEILKLRKAKLGANHPDTLASMIGVAKSYRDAGKLDLALPLLQEAAAGIEKQQDQHERADQIVRMLIDCHERLEQLSQAEKWWRKWLATSKQRVGADSMPYARKQSGLGLNLLQQKKWADAEPVLRECLSICEKDADHWMRFHVQMLLGGALLGQKKYTEAEPLLLQGYERMKKDERGLPLEFKTSLRQAAGRLVQLYEATNQPAKARAWREKSPPDPAHQP